ncbi:cytosolic 5'-nucleotidase 3-like [Homalodisca vitripennis]|uniref:cytosolic 5'-nucleotidase 3-like n=1 Tax=Homalodisca vitripennis TaxID=197043 RepID=UPI001EEB3991|nr:cytosolic 5'-nucleotidase 3-like [Homalodisca vitripennis]KAG8295199.1 7-methylguanosine phosphate-specific 5'-nucleotidase [Homalodisca vitripennis]
MLKKDLLISKLDSILGPNVVLKDKEDFLTKLTNMVEDGVSNLQFVTDFDDTITKHIVGGKCGATSFDVFRGAKTFTQTYSDRVDVCLSKLKDNLFNSKAEQDQQEEIDSRICDVYACSVGEKVAIPDIHEAAERIIIPLKDDCKELLSLLSELKVPLTVVSVGPGEVIEHILKEYNPKVVANYVTFKDDVITDLRQPSVGMYNKHEFPLPVDADRSNFIVIGDFAWDSKIADNVKNKKNVLKIGFFYGRRDDTIKEYLNFFDVLLLHDETMNVPLNILKLVADKTEPNSFHKG